MIPCLMHVSIKIGDLGFMIFDNMIIIIGILGVLTLLIMTYLIIRRSVKKKLAEARAKLSTNRSAHYSNAIVSESRKESRVIRLFITIAVVYIISYLPFNMLSLLKQTGQLSNMHGIQLLKVHIALYILTVSQAAFNPMLTLYLKDDFRRSLKRKTRKKRYLSDPIAASFQSKTSIRMREV